jgi:hypothetical protein
MEETSLQGDYYFYHPDTGRYVKRARGAIAIDPKLVEADSRFMASRGWTSVPGSKEQLGVQLPEQQGG